MKTITLAISGMSCRSCQSHVAKALREVQGVTDVSVDLESNTATVSGESPETASLVAAVENEVYGANLGVETESPKLAG